MSDVTYINTQQIRQDLMGFLNQLAAGRQYVVLHRSKPVVQLTGKSTSMSKAQARQNIQQFLATAEKARKTAKGTLDPTKSSKELYTESMAKKYGLLGHEYPY